MSRVPSRILAVLVLAGLCAGAPAAAQTAAGTVQATLTIEPPPLQVSGIQPLDFGFHPVGSGLVQNSLDAEWYIEGVAGTSVDLFFSALPTGLQGPNGAVAPLTYGSGSMGIYCGDGTGTYVDPSVGFSACIISTGGNALVELGPTITNGFVQVDLTGLPEGSYTAVIELTAVVN